MSARVYWLAGVVIVAGVVGWLEWPPTAPPPPGPKGIGKARIWSTGKPRIPPPVVSPEFVAATKDVLEMEPADVAEMERRVQADPKDWRSRARAMAYYARGDQAARPESDIQRKGHVQWLLDHDPESEILGSYLARMNDEDIRRRCEAALRKHPTNAKVAWNISQFYAGEDTGRYVELLRLAVKLDPSNGTYGQRLGIHYGTILVQGGRMPEQAQQVLREVETTDNPWVLEPVVRTLQSQHNSALMTGRTEKEFGDLAARLFERVVELNPDVDQQWVMPRLEPEMVGMLTRRQPPAETMKEAPVRRLDIDKFPQLPEGVRAELKRRGCQIPQANAEGPGKNVVQGQFFAAGQTGWAVLCSVKERSSILVFRDDSDRQPQELAKADDSGFFQGMGKGVMEYSRGIAAVDRKYILMHYRAYGGPEPPVVDHQGIDDAFLGKASVIWYWHGGKWIQLQGAD